MVRSSSHDPRSTHLVYVTRTTNSRDVHGHSPASWATMWKEVIEEYEGEGAGERIVVSAELESNPVSAKRGMKTLVWSVRRV